MSGGGRLSSCLRPRGATKAGRIDTRRGGPAIQHEVIDGDTSTADSYLTESARSSCRGYSEGGPLPARIVLISTTERDNSALVRVSVVVSSGSGGPFGPSEYEMEDRFSLIKDNGKWLVDQAPYQLLSCKGPAVKP